jgi:hypothetical protein
MSDTSKSPAASNISEELSEQRRDDPATPETPTPKGKPGSWIQRVTAVAALVIGFLSLGVSFWAAARTLEYSRLTSKPHVKPYLTNIQAIDRGNESDRGLIYCETNVRLVNTGGAGAILEAIDVTARIGSDSQTQFVDAVREYTDAFGTSFIGNTSFTAYALGDTFPLLVRPYDVAEIVDLTAELESKEFEFLRTPGESLNDRSGYEVAVSFRLHFADDSELSIPEEHCTYALRNN